MSSPVVLQLLTQTLLKLLKCCPSWSYPCLPNPKPFWKCNIYNTSTLSKKPKVLHNRKYLEDLLYRDTWQEALASVMISEMRSHHVFQPESLNQRTLRSHRPVQTCAVQKTVNILPAGFQFIPGMSMINIHPKLSFLKSCCLSWMTWTCRYFPDHIGRIQIRYQFQHGNNPQSTEMYGAVLSPWWKSTWNIMKLELVVVCMLLGYIHLLHLLCYRTVFPISRNSLQ